MMRMQPLVLLLLAAVLLLSLAPAHADPREVESAEYVAFKHDWINKSIS